ncbi:MULTISPECIES: hypothetical protein [Acidiphilium]|uniref:hypothetical protein n=1 Tax=Acidiphilium TaxID=522 RepID=UPI0012DF425A|nr:MULTISPECIES: hypothetical protein [Acidiphilium]
MKEFSMSKESKAGHGMEMDGFGKIKPLTEGYIAKGGRNLSSTITQRPPAPAVLTQGGKAPAPATTNNKK